MTIRECPAAATRAFFLTADGGLYEWNKSREAQGPLIFQFDRSIYDDPSLLYDAQPVNGDVGIVVAVLEQKHGPLDAIFTASLAAVLDR